MDRFAADEPVYASLSAQGSRVKAVLHFFTKTKAGNILIKYVLALVLLAYVVSKNWNGLLEVFRRPVRVQPLVLATAIYICCLMVTFLRWHYLVRTVGLPFTRYNAVRLGLAGFYYNTFMPGAIGGDFVKAYAIAKENSRRTLAASTVLIDRVIGLWALVWFISIVGTTYWLLGDPMLKNDVLRGIVLSTYAIVGVSMTLWFALGFVSEEQAANLATNLATGSRFRGSLAELWRACWMYRRQSKAVLNAMLITLVAHAGWVLVFHFSVQAFEAPNPETEIGTLAEHSIVYPVGMTVSAFIPLPGGIGVGEAAFGRLYKTLGKPEVNGIVGCMSMRVITICLGLIGYLIYTRMRANPASIESPTTETTSDPPEKADAALNLPLPAPQSGMRMT